MSECVLTLDVCCGGVKGYMCLNVCVRVCVTALHKVVPLSGT